MGETGDSNPVIEPCQCRAARGLLDWTQDHLAKVAGVSRSTIRDFENGRHQLHRSSAVDVIRAFREAGVSLLGDASTGYGVRLSGR